MIDIDPQDFRAQAADILAGTIGITVTRAVTAGHEEGAVGGEGERASVMTITRSLDNHLA